MGTRHLISVVFDHKTKIAQYGQWDGYPSGQGFGILEFLRSADVAKFKEKLQNCKFFDNEKRKEYEAFCESIGAKNGWVDSIQSALIREKYPTLNRDLGSDILQMVLDSTGELWLNDSSDFAEDNVNCDWRYLLDMDANTLSVFEGTDTKPIKVYDIANLPTNEDFEKQLEPEETE